MSQIELQRVIERHTSKFIEDVTAVADALPRTGSEQQQDALRRILGYASAALDIASGPVPEVNVLDMLVFATLCRRVLEGSWLGELFGEGAHGLIVVFAEFERLLWEVSDRILDGPQQHQLRELIRGWSVAHPGDTRVEWVRFEDISNRASDNGSEQGRNGRGILRSIRLAAKTADDALLLGERALFVTRRMPSLLRLHVRVGAQELLADIGRLRNVRAELSETTELRPLDRVLRRCMSTLGAALIGWLLPRELRATSSASDRTPIGPTFRRSTPTAAAGAG